MTNAIPDTSLLFLDTELEDRHDAMVRRLAKPGADILLSKPKGFGDLVPVAQAEWTARRDELLAELTFTPSRANINHACIGLGGEPGEIAVLLTLKDGEPLTTGLLEETGDAYFTPTSTLAFSAKNSAASSFRSASAKLSV